MSSRFSLEQQIQGLGVSLGDFDAENEFVTVKLLLAESRLIKRAIKSFISHAFDGLAWTLLYYTMLWIGFAAFVLVAFLGLYLLREAARLYKAADTKFAKEQ